MLPLGLFAAAIPFGFGALRAFSTGTDLRYVWIALAAAVASVAVFASIRRTAPSAATAFMAALLASTASASAAGFVLGAQSIPAVLVVAVGFAVCEAGGCSLVHRALAS